MRWLAFFRPITPPFILSSSLSTPVEQSSLKLAGALPDDNFITTTSTSLDDPPSPPRWRYILTANINIDTYRYNVNVGGAQSNSVVNGGNWTNANGDIIASVVRRLGSRTGTIYTNNLFTFGMFKLTL